MDALEPVGTPEPTTRSVDTPRSRASQLWLRFGWGVADQGISSVGNFALGLILARSLSAEHFGAFTLSYVTYSLVLNASRGVASDPLLVRFSHSAVPVWRKAVASSTAVSAAMGVLCGVVCVVVGFFLPHDVGAGFIALGLTLPGLMLQDSWRFAFFSQTRGRSAFMNDLLWTVLMIGSLAALEATGDLSVFKAVLAFGLTATVAAGFGLVQSRVIPDPRGIRPWIHDHRDLAGRYLGENISMSGAVQLRAVALVAVGGLTAVGDLRVAEMLMGPFLIVLMGLSQVAVPEASRQYRRGAASLKRFCLRMGIVQAMIAAAWALGLAIALPLGLGDKVFGPIWRPAAHLLLPMTVNVMAFGFCTAYSAGLRATGRARQSLNAQLIASAAYLTGGVVGAMVGGVYGLAWGTAISSLGAALFWRHRLYAVIDNEVPPAVVPEQVMTELAVAGEGMS